MMMSSLRSENRVGGKVIFSEHKPTANVFFYDFNKNNSGFYFIFNSPIWHTILVL